MVNVHGPDHMPSFPASFSAHENESRRQALSAHFSSSPYLSYINNFPTKNLWKTSLVACNRRDEDSKSKDYINILQHGFRCVVNTRLSHNCSLNTRQPHTWNVRGSCTKVGHSRGQCSRSKPVTLITFSNVVFSKIPLQKLVAGNITAWQDYKSRRK